MYCGGLFLFYLERNDSMFFTTEDKEKNDLKVLSEFWASKEAVKKRLQEKDLSEAAIHHCQSILSGIEKTMQEIDDEKKQVMHYMYETDYDKADIADELYISKVRVGRLHDYVLKLFGKNMGFI